MKHHSVSRRRVLRGLLQGSTVGIGLPMLDLFLNDNGNALASGEPLPSCFGTWFWGLGLCPNNWAPETTGRDYAMRPQLQALEPVRDKLNIYSGMQVHLDGPTGVHFTAPQCTMTGRATDASKPYGLSIDNIVAKELGVRTRFPTISMTCSGRSQISWTSRGDTITPSEVSPLALYQRIFVTGFQDPNSAEFTPDPAVMLRHSLLSYVSEERQDLINQVGANDKVRLDEFFTSLRTLEQKLALELEKPEPMPACQGMSEGPDRSGSSVSLPDMLETHELMSQIITHALACGQTRVFNMAMDRDAVRPGHADNNHNYSHEEPVDPVLGYQPNCYWFANQFMESFRYLISMLDSIQEGDGTLLDRTLMMAYSDHGDARVHGVLDLPIFTAGGAGLGVKNGMHLAAKGDSCARIGLTCQQALGLPVSSWGTGANKVSQAFTEVLA